MNKSATDVGKCDVRIIRNMMSDLEPDHSRKLYNLLSSVVTSQPGRSIGILYRLMFLSAVMRASSSI